MIPNIKSIQQFTFFPTKGNSIFCKTINKVDLNKSCIHLGNWAKEIKGFGIFFKNPTTIQMELTDKFPYPNPMLHRINCFVVEFK